MVVKAPIVRDVMKKPSRTFEKDQAMLEAADIHRAFAGRRGAGD